MSNEEIANVFKIGRRTVEAYMRAIFNEMGVGSRTEAAIYALKKEWLDIDALS